MRGFRQGLFSLALAATFVLAFASPADARPGDLDDKFGAGGIVDLGGTTENPGGGAAVAGSDGRVFYLEVEDLSQGRFNIAALDRTGDMDTSFAQSGRIHLPPIGGGSLVFSPTPSGGVFFVGSDPDTRAERILKFTRDGDPDNSFGGDGIVTFPDTSRSIVSAAYDDTGRLLVGFSVFTGDYNNSDYEIVRLRGDGSIDPSFGSGGTVTPPIEGAGIVLGKDGSFFVSSSATFNSLAFAKYTQDGQLVRSYGLDGVAETPTDPAQELSFGASVAVDPQGRIVYVNSLLTPPDETGFLGRKYRIARLDPSGNPDTTFTAAPSLLEQSPTGDVFSLVGLLIDDQGRILISGSYGRIWATNTTDNSVPTIARLQPDGSLDPSFGEGGISSFPLTYSDFPFASFSGISFADPDHVVSNSFGFISKIELNDEPANADGDRVKDRKDGCPRRYSTRKDGCGRIGVKVSIERKGRSVSGSIDTDELCLSRGGRKPARVDVFEGKDHIGRAQVDQAGDWNLRLPRGTGRVRGEYRQTQRGEIAVCRSARSKSA